MVSINNQSNVIDMLHNIYFQCTCMTKHYSDMIVMASQISGKSITCLCFQQDNTQVRIAALLWREFIGNRWTPLTKGQ